LKKFIGLSLVILSLLLIIGCSSDNVAGTHNGEDEGKIKVYTSFYTMYDFALKVGGDKIRITNLVPTGTEPHDWEPTASDIIGLEKADVLIYNGAGLEHWTEDVLASLQNKDLLVVEASSGIELLDEAELEESDPHIWLDPLKAKIEMENIKKALVEADPENKDYYEENYEMYSIEFDNLHNEYKAILDPLINRDIVVSHEAFGYLTKAYDLNQIAIEGLTPDSEPTPSRIAQIIDFAKVNHVKVIFFEEMVSPKVAESIAKAIDAKTAILNPLEGLTDEQIENGNDYFSVMRENLKTLEDALK